MDMHSAKYLRHVLQIFPQECGTFSTSRLLITYLIHPKHSFWPGHEQRVADSSWVPTRVCHREGSELFDHISPWAVACEPFLHLTFPSLRSIFTIGDVFKHEWLFSIQSEQQNESHTLVGKTQTTQTRLAFVVAVSLACACACANCQGKLETGGRLRPGEDWDRGKTETGGRLRPRHRIAIHLSICIELIAIRCHRDFAPQLFRPPQGEIRREIALPRAIIKLLIAVTFLGLQTVFIYSSDLTIRRIRHYSWYDYLKVSALIVHSFVTLFLNSINEESCFCHHWNFDNRLERANNRLSSEWNN